jgi:PAS domain S-box-containing protein
MSEIIAPLLMRLPVRTLLESLPFPVLIAGSAGEILAINRAFRQTFAWSQEALAGQPVYRCFARDDQRAVRNVVEQVWQAGEHRPASVAHCQTPDGQVRDVSLEGARLADESGNPAYILLTIRDISAEQQLARRHRALLRIAEKLHDMRGMDDLLEYVAREVQALLEVGGAMVVLADEEAGEFFFRAAALDNGESGQRMQAIRFPLSDGVAGQVFRTGQPLIVPDTSQNPYFSKRVDEEAGYHTRNMLDVPLEVQQRRIGVLCAVNKRHGAFDHADLEVLQTIANTIALPLENARIHAELSRSYQDIQALNRAKDRVIHHLSHELKTPLSVVAASLQLLRKRLADAGEQGYHRILDRAQRNVQRILDIQYEVEDILRDKQHTTYGLLSILLDACVDELDVLIADELGEWTVMQRLRRRIEELFGPREAISRKIELGPFVQRQIDQLRQQLGHRQLELITQIEPAAPIWIPPDVLAKIVEGLVRNASENTPDGSRMTIAVTMRDNGPLLSVRDYGIGMTAENQRMLVENYFPAYEMAQYASRKPFDFYAGGKGFDLLRMRIFSERYRFHLQITSQRCVYIPHDHDLCPGAIAACAFCRGPQDCLDSGGTTVLVQFSAIEDLGL